jgi:hypothetical protein
MGVGNALQPIVKPALKLPIVTAMKLIARSVTNTIGNAQILLRYLSALTKLGARSALQFVSMTETQKPTP